MFLMSWDLVFHGMEFLASALNFLLRRRLFLWVFIDVYFWNRKIRAFDFLSLLFKWRALNINLNFICLILLSEHLYIFLTQYKIFLKYKILFSTWKTFSMQLKKCFCSAVLIHQGCLKTFPFLECLHFVIF